VGFLEPAPGQSTERGRIGRSGALDEGIDDHEAGRGHHPGVDEALRATSGGMRSGSVDATMTGSSSVEAPVRTPSSAARY
jgi:hypothetical protein